MVLSWGLYQPTVAAQRQDATQPDNIPRPKLDCRAVSERSAYGHFPYAEASRRDLVSVGNGEYLRSSAAASFLAMQQAAAREGIRLVALSGFRDRSTQESLFFGIAAQRGQSLNERARVSAPPGYSEHHTGYAIDIGDANAPESDVRPDFEMTAAGMWLIVRAPEYGFEMSFPRTHPCINYEPWHWRWVGDEYSQATFRTAREMMRR
ncbi:MAG: M15 family metallopeptidase [Cyanobacteria bacterium SID2]|nr:M15 family metallopeptidase [Cyanobacteria bacterium SID2]MBP0005522.1 M15 family metallopeptidase [Cyanobacteria bacterium SBC]